MPIPVGRIIDRQRRNASANNLVFPENIGPHGLLMMFREYNFDETRNNQQFNFSNPNRADVKDTILLPLPKILRDNISVSIQQQQLGIFGEQVASAASATRGADSLGGLATALGNAVSQNLPSGSELAKSLEGIVNGEGMTDQLSQQLSFLGRRSLNQLPGNIGRSVDAGLGTVVNPKAALAFDGVSLKSHNFEWEFAPKTRNESEMLKKVFNTLKRNSLPSYIDVNLNADSNIFARGLLKYPSLVDVFLLGLDPSHYLYFKTSMVKNVSIDFTPHQGHAILAGGKPAIVTLSMEISETDIHTSEDYGGESDGVLNERGNI